MPPTWESRQRLASGGGARRAIINPDPRQPAYAFLGYGPGTLPVTERLTSEVLQPPISPETDAPQAQQRVVGEWCAASAPSRLTGPGAKRNLSPGRLKAGLSQTSSARNS